MSPRFVRERHGTLEVDSPRSSGRRRPGGAETSWQSPRLRHHGGPRRRRPRPPRPNAPPTTPCPPPPPAAAPRRPPAKAQDGPWESSSSSSSSPSCGVSSPLEWALARRPHPLHYQSPGRSGSGSSDGLLALLLSHLHRRKT